jgi:hypothetical protein
MSEAKSWPLGSTRSQSDNASNNIDVHASIFFTYHGFFIISIELDWDNSVLRAGCARLLSDWKV